jgi:hypothetical protein
MHRTLILLVLLALCATPGRADLSNYVISPPLGLTDAKHTATNGRQSSRVWFAAGDYGDRVDRGVVHQHPRAGGVVL